MLGQLGRRHAALAAVGALILGTIGIAGSDAATGDKQQAKKQAPAITAAVGQPHKPAEAVKPASQNPALKRVMAKYLQHGRRDYLGLENGLAALGATGLTIGGRTPAQAQAAQDNPKTKAAPAASGNGKCPAASSKVRFNCELLFFHEVSPGYTYQGDVAVLSWDFEFLGADKPKGSPLDDIAAIDFGNYNEKCYEPGQASSAAWTHAPGTELNGEPAKDVSDHVRPESVSPENNAAVWRVIDDPQDGTQLPTPLVGYVQVSLQHRLGAPGCEKFEEIRAAGHYLHNEEGDGDWSGVSIGGSFGPLSVNYTPKTDPGIEQQSSTGVLALHEPDVVPTQLNYTGPTHISYHVPFTASARLTGGATAAAQTKAAAAAQTKAGQSGPPIPNAKIQFTIGLGGGTQTCTGVTNKNGVASCQLTPTQKSGPTTLTLRYLGGKGTTASSSFIAFTVQHLGTSAAYTGPKRIANGTPAKLSGTLREQGGPGVVGKPLTLALGNGSNRQTCTGTTDTSGTARCTIPKVDQPLNASATVPVSVAFSGDDFYLSSSKTATVLLEYYTGRSYGLTSSIKVPLLVQINVPPSPDTEGVRTAHAFTTTTGCTASLSAAALVTTSALCPKVQTSLAPGTSTATSRVDKTTIGVPGLPVIEVRGATATSTTTCKGAVGDTQLAGLYVAGQRVAVSAKLNSTIDIAGVHLVTNERISVAGGISVNAVHLTALNGNVDVVVASATSGIHNCAS